MIDNIIPRSNRIWEENTHVSRRLASYFMKGIIIILTVQRSAVSREFVFKIRRRLFYSQSYVSVENTSTPTTFR